jgi:hypothetical protein
VRAAAAVLLVIFEFIRDPQLEEKQKNRSKGGRPAARQRYPPDVTGGHGKGQDPETHRRDQESVTP